MPQSKVADMLYLIRPSTHRFLYRCGNTALVRASLLFLAAKTLQFRLLQMRSNAACGVTMMALAIFICLGLCPSSAEASKYAAIVINETTGKVMFSRNADHLRYPASLTKIMTLYLLFEDIEAGSMTLKTRIPVSKIAANRSPSKLNLKPGQTISAEQAIYALVTKSANDVATALAEKLSGVEREFAKRMDSQSKGTWDETYRVQKRIWSAQSAAEINCDMAKLALPFDAIFQDFTNILALLALTGKAVNLIITISCCPTTAVQMV